MHISEQVAAALIADGWARTVENGDTLFRKSRPTGGAFGQSRVCLCLDVTGRWLERSDGWGDVEREVDLRDWQGNAAGAITAALHGKDC